MTRATALATFYAFVGLVFGGLAIYVRGGVWTHPDPWFSLSPWGAHAYSILLGFTVGLLGVGATFALVKKTHWAKLLHEELRPSVSGMPWQGIIAVALFSSLGEEILFRSVLQTSTNLWIQALVFGLAHQLPGRSRWTWVLWATIMGVVFGVLFEATGSLLGPIVAHATINGMNLRFLQVHQTQPAARTVGGILGPRIES
jgi:uncharacterized protein